MIDRNGSRPRRMWQGWAAMTLRLHAGAAAAAAALVPAAVCAAPPKMATQIGVVMPESAPDKTRGEEIRNGMLLALKTWPGQPAPTLVVKDSACEAKQAAAAAQALVDAKVDVVVGGFCVVGPVPRILGDAGVPFISANAVRFAPAPEASIQFGAVPASLIASVGLKLRSETGLKVNSTSGCWIDYEQRVPDGFDAALCPTPHVDNARWEEVAPTYAAAYRKPFTTAAAQGYAAMQVALAAIRQLRAGSKPAAALKDTNEVATVLGTVRYRDDAAMPADAMQLIVSARLPRLSAREAVALDELMKSKGCACTKSGDCPQSAAWSTMPFVVTKGAACPAKH